MAETSPDSANGETTAFISPPLDRTTQNMTEFRLTLAKQVNGKKTTSAMLKQALDHYDIEVGVEALTTPVLAILDYIFSLEEVEWPSEQDHVYMMAGKVRLALQSFLRILG